MSEIMGKFQANRKEEKKIIALLSFKKLHYKSFLIKKKDY